MLMLQLLSHGTKSLSKQIIHFGYRNFQTIDHILCLFSQEYPGNDITKETPLFNFKLQKRSSGVLQT